MTTPTPFKVILRTLGIQTFYKQQATGGKRVSLLMFISTCMSECSHSSTLRVPTFSHPTPLDQLAMVMVWSILSICPAHPLASGTCAIIPSHALQRTRPYAPAKGDSVAPCLCLIPLGMGTHMLPPVKLCEPSQAFPGHVRAIHSPAAEAGDFSDFNLRLQEGQGDISFYQSPIPSLSLCT